MRIDADQLTCRHPDVIESLRAGRNHEFVAYLQPKVCLTTRRTVGFEALLRWLPHPGIALSPAHTLPTIESSGLLHDIWVIMLRYACALLRQLPNSQRQCYPIAVNLHPGLLNDPLLTANAIAVASSMGIDPALLEFEIIETGRINDLDFAAQSIFELREAGFAVVLDDFGASYASLLHLAHLPVTGVKVDRAFLAAPHCVPVVRSLVGLACEMGLTLVVEGIETEEQVTLAIAAGASIGQGYLFSRPRHADEVWPAHQAATIEPAL